MYKKASYRRRPSSRFALLIAIVLIIGLFAFSVYEYMNVKDLSKKSEQIQQQNSSLESQLQTLQSQYQTLQDQYQALQNSNKTSQTSVTSSTKGKIAYLTFDDGPTNLTPQLLEVLNELNVKATFFIAFMGEDTSRKRALLKQEADAGHTIGIHSWTHQYNTIYKNEQSFLNDFNKMKDIIVSATGVEPKVSRFPGGIGNTVSITASGKEIMPVLVNDVRDMGITPFDWNAGGEDATTPYPTTDELVQDVLNDAKGHDNLIILLHDAHQFTIDAVPEIVKQLRAQGYTFEMLSPDSKTVRQAFAKRN